MIIVLVMLGLTIYHLFQWSPEHIGFITVVTGASFAWLVVQLYLAHSHRDILVDGELLITERPFDVRIVVPIHNEDPITFRALLESVAMQSYPANFTYLIDDGSYTSVDGVKIMDTSARDVFDAFVVENPHMKSRMSYEYVSNRGKREAQAIAFRKDRESDVIFTIDSDTVLDEHAILNGVMGYTDPRVMSVGGLLHGLNAYSNMLTRLTNLGFVLSFLNGRAAWSRFGSVAVHCGGLASYRSWVIRKYLDEYENQVVFGHRRTSGDDRVLTNFALLEGRCVIQESCVGYTLLPENMKHLTNQRIRWWRSFFWGGLWLIVRFPMNRLVWWLVAFQFVTFGLYSVILPITLIIHPVMFGYLPVLFLLYLSVLGYARSARYLTVSRPNESKRQQFATFLLTPLSVLLHLYLCSVLQFFGLFTVNNGAWSTRKKVEVGIAIQDTSSQTAYSA